MVDTVDANIKAKLALVAFGGAGLAYERAEPPVVQSRYSRVAKQE
jgi:hypothetical protein